MDGFSSFIALLGLKPNPWTLNIFLPVGISFYIFLSLSYLIDVYHRKLAAARNFIEVLLSFSFFPIILAGPIERPIHLLPQIRQERIFDYVQSADGLRQILWGAFMKIVIADRCAIPVHRIFADSSAYAGSTLFLGLFMFTIQIYADFAGYSYIAIGTGKLFGFHIQNNFAFPYFAQDIRSFWKRWNISLTTWFRDYVFLPLAYFISDCIKSDRLLRINTNSIIYASGLAATWILIGLWHGANGTYIIWGLLQGLFLFLNHIAAKPKNKFLRYLHIRNDHFVVTTLDRLVTIAMILFSWIFFRADNIRQALTYISGIFSSSIFQLPRFDGMKSAGTTLILIIIFLAMEWLGRKQEYGIARLGFRWPRPLRWAAYYALIFAIACFLGHERQFIYFQF